MGNRVRLAVFAKQLGPGSVLQRSSPSRSAAPSRLDSGCGFPFHECLATQAEAATQRLSTTALRSQFAHTRMLALLADGGCA